jgi:hypothetical protein
VDETLLKLRILTRAEVTLARVHSRVFARRLLLAAVALGALVLAVGMLNLGAYEMLSIRLGDGPAAFVVSAANGAFAMLLLYIASRMKPGPEEQMIHEIRDLALAELSAETETIKSNIGQVVSDIEQIQHNVASFASTASAGIGSLGPIVGLAVDALKRRNG